MSENENEKKKSGIFGKLLKVLLWTLAGLVAFVLLLVATMPLWISPVSTGTANSIVPKITGTDFHLGRFYVNPWTGAIRIEDVKLSNPEGFGTAPAFSVKLVSVDVKLYKLVVNKLHIKELLIEDAFASYYSHDGVNNIEAILANVEKALGGKKEKEEKPEEEEEKKGGMKIIIDHLNISGTKVKLMENDVIPPVPIFIPELSDIGKESDGATFAETWKSLSDSFMKGMGSVGDGLGALGGLIGDGASATGDATKKAASAVSDGTKAAADATVDATKKAASTVSDGAKAAADAVGDTAKKATEGIKNLFK